MPLIVRWPGVSRAGSVIEVPVATPDVFASVCEALGVAGAASDGIPLSAVLRGESAPDRALFWHYPHYGNQGGAPGGAIRHGDWKLIEWYEDGRLELFNLRDDPGETTDRAGSEPDRVRALHAELVRWRGEVGAKMPAPNPAFDPAKPSGRAAARTAEAPAVRPNFVLINVDDLGYADISPFGAEYATPRLDRMAQEGRRLASHYAAPVCSPSRAALMTGGYPKRVLPVPHALFPAARVGLHTQEVTVAEVLKSVGYATACVGKWHLGDQPEFLPPRQGFDEYYGLPYSNDMGPARDGAKSNPGRPLPPRRVEPLPDSIPEDGIRGAAQPPLPWLDGERVVARVTAAEQRQLVRRYTDRSLEFIRRHRDRPFFLYLAHSAVHFPLYPDPAFDGRSGRNLLLGDWVLEVDASTGEILDELRTSGLASRTLVIFTSDNGGSLTHGSSNAPLRGAKGSTWEGGVRVPTIAWWPGRIPAGTRTHAITTVMDILPTFAGLAGAPLPPWRKLDGVDIWPVLCGNETLPLPREEFLYFRGLNLEAVRRGRWKLILGSGELYDLESDLGETRDVAASNPDVVRTLRALAEAADRDLGVRGIGPGVRALGRVEATRVWITPDSN